MFPAAAPCRSLPLIACFFALLFCPCAAQTGTPNTGKPTQFTNGQPGTPNLPTAPCRFIDLTHMRNTAVGAVDKGTYHALKTLDFATEFDVAVQNYLKARNDPAHTNPAVALAKLQLVVNVQYLEVQNNAADNYFPNSSFYVGSEARTGSGKTEYILPVLTYCDNRSGTEFGTESFFEFGDSDSGVRDGVGISIKTELTRTTRDFSHEVTVYRAAVAKIDAIGRDKNSGGLSDVKVIHDLVNKNGSLSADKLEQLKEIAGRYKGIAAAPEVTQLQQDLSLDIDPSPNSAVTMPFPPAYEKLLTASALGKQNKDLLQKYVEFAKKPIVAGFVGNRFYNQGGGSLLDGGISASQLFPFRQGGAPAGVTALVVAQGFDDRLQGGPRRGAERLGLAAIWQDRTPFYVAETRRLAAPWNVKVGLEYTSPLLGLKPGYATFVRYRTLPSYIEITLAAGKDGQRKDYLDLSVGKSVAF